MADTTEMAQANQPAVAEDVKCAERTLWENWTGFFFWRKMWKITNREITMERIGCGCCSMELDTMSINRVIDVKFSRSCFQLLMCGRGTLHIYAADASSSHTQISTWGTKEVYEELKQIVSKNAVGSRPQVAIEYDA